MRMVDVIQSKKDGQALTRDEIRFFTEGVVSGAVPDYQAAALLMAICFQGMNPVETLDLTMAMVDSGEQTDLSGIPGLKVDKHSTGGVGDKTTLILAPLVAACGVPVAKMSGRGLGHTGGTIDKLESIPGFSTNLSTEAFIDCVNRVGLAVAGQTGRLVPADKKLYALRDVTATIGNISLIASSIMSKKLASGADAIVLDVKMGSGAFMHTLPEAEALARAMVDIGNGAGRRTVAVLTDMDQPLGLAVGNALEVREAIEVLQGRGPGDIRELCLVLGAIMLELAGKGDTARCRELAEAALDGGAALQKFRDMVRGQGGNPDVADFPDMLPTADIRELYRATSSGIIQKIVSDLLGMASMELGAGRRTKEEGIDPAAGIVLLKKPGDTVCAGEPVAVLHTGDRRRIPAASALLDEAVSIGTTAYRAVPLILETIR
jgi:pyrimidine-nucleoside phosphorylase